MRIQNRIVLGFAIALTISSAAAAQGRSGPATPADTKSDVAITLQVAGQPYHFEGKAACQHAQTASIYNVDAQLWIVTQSDGLRSITLTLWRPKGTSGDMFSLSTATGGKSYLVSAVKPDGESAVEGSGKVVLTTSGAGGTFTIKAITAKGAAITGSIRCGAFKPVIAEGGN